MLILFIETEHLRTFLFLLKNGKYLLQSNLSYSLLYLMGRYKKKSDKAAKDSCWKWETAHVYGKEKK